MRNELQYIIYNLPDESGKVQVVIKDETIWCTQKAMAKLFGIDKSGITVIFPIFSKMKNLVKIRQLQKLQPS